MKAIRRRSLPKTSDPSSGEESGSDSESDNESAKSYDPNALLYLDFSDAGLENCDQIVAEGDISKLEFLLLPNNRLLDIMPLQMCVKLRKLDLSNNRLDKLPEKKFWSRLVSLEVLHLHNNLISSLLPLSGLMECEKLRILTLYRNPIALHPSYRQVLVQGVPSLLALDHYIVSDEEYLQGYSFGARYGAFSSALRMPEEPRSNMTGYDGAVDTLRRLLRAVVRQYLANSPAAKIQRAFRLHRVRYDVLKQSAALLIQPLARGFLTRRRVMRGKSDECAVAPADTPPKSKHKHPKTPTTVPDHAQEVYEVYFLPEQKEVISELLRRAVGGLVDVYRNAVKFDMTPLMLTVSYPQPLFREKHPDRDFGSCLPHNKLRFSPDPVRARQLSIIKRRSYRSS